MRSVRSGKVIGSSVYRKSKASANNIETVLAELRAGMSVKGIVAQTGVALNIVESLSRAVSDTVSLHSSLTTIKSFMLDISIDIKKLRGMPIGKVDHNLLQLQIDEGVAKSQTVIELRESIDRLALMVESLLRIYAATYQPGSADRGSSPES